VVAVERSIARFFVDRDLSQLVRGVSTPPSLMRNRTLHLRIGRPIRAIRDHARAPRRLNRPIKRQLLTFFFKASKRIRARDFAQQRRKKNAVKRAFALITANFDTL
jgi:hypothetical protein